MSKSMIQTFFSANYQYVTTNESPLFSIGNYLLNEIIFPDDVATMCPEVVINIYSYKIRQPILAMNALFGLIIGFKCGYDLWILSSRKKMQQQLQSTSSSSSSSFVLWSLAYITFGIMNLSAIPLHCLLDAPTSTYPDQNPILWSIDTYMTGTSSICLLMASVEEISYTTKKGSTEQQTIIIAIETITKIRSTIASSWNRLSFIVLDFDDDNDIIILISTTFYFCFRGLVPISTITRWITNTILFVVIETKTNL
jgi:hypothetical protein